MAVGCSSPLSRSSQRYSYPLTSLPRVSPPPSNHLSAGSNSGYREARPSRFPNHYVASASAQVPFRIPQPQQFRAASQGRSFFPETAIITAPPQSLATPAPSTDLAKNYWKVVSSSYFVNPEFNDFANSIWEDSNSAQGRSFFVGPGIQIIYGRNAVRELPDKPIGAVRASVAPRQQKALDSRYNFRPISDYQQPHPTVLGERSLLTDSLFEHSAPGIRDYRSSNTGRNLQHPPKQTHQQQPQQFDARFQQPQRQIAPQKRTSLPAVTPQDSSHNRNQKQISVSEPRLAHNPSALANPASQEYQIPPISKVVSQKPYQEAEQLLLKFVVSDAGGPEQVAAIDVRLPHSPESPLDPTLRPERTLEHTSISGNQKERSSYQEDDTAKQNQNPEINYELLDTKYTFVLDDSGDEVQEDIQEFIEPQKGELEVRHQASEIVPGFDQRTAHEDFDTTFYQPSSTFIRPLKESEDWLSVLNSPKLHHQFGWTPIRR
ncbi:unnamed protein product [Cyprideis torosa]|uniref:Uncharacterized protein n=1 Tax=Cyprideis torosa TaxID=163714 RepID=A0A7R8ZGK8_9CRUS|nr:unnamed protein product [Cyprideis torosa]CAG0880282.1 unnamed protein product [Cyprideis torosa]